MSNLKKQDVDCETQEKVPLSNMKRNISQVNNTYEFLLINMDYDRSGYVRNICTSVVECIALEAGKNCRKGSKLCEFRYLIFKEYISSAISHNSCSFFISFDMNTFNKTRSESQVSTLTRWASNPLGVSSKGLMLLRRQGVTLGSREAGRKQMTRVS